MKRVIITGGSGFVGSNTIPLLEEKGYEVINFDLKEGFDVRKRYQLKNVIKKGDKVLHLAAIARFAEADENPLLAFETNYEGTKNVAEVCKENGAERLVYSSTGSVYMPIDEEPPIKETFKAKGNSVYACTKFAAEEAIRKSGMKHIILRYAHLYGEGKVGHGAIGGFISRMSRGLAPILYGGKQSNDFTYVKDIALANLTALEIDKEEAFNQAYNIGTGEELTTEEVFNILADRFDYHKEFEKFPIRTVDPLRFMFDVSKAEQVLGFKAKYNFKDGLDDYLKVGTIPGWINRDGKA